MATIDADNLEFCVDCVQMIANGEGTDAHMGDMIELWGEGINGVLGLVLTCSEDCEGWFSRWKPCDGCGSTLGGDRHPGAHIVSGAFNDPRVSCCNRDIADCDCETPNHD